MKKVTYNGDVDILLIEFSDESIAYAEQKGNKILHYSDSDKLVLIEILNFRRLLLASA
ncbi:DUF2283 domain-containing protein [Gloeocapsa sp. PCC 73106]|uniref:DUF2283 domain-containing protein n=1 Tax=Gloeocapsa sp. PCC 73106 TaxID=102232 RepID=UPI0002AD1514|nr:DUF2283 domain-containing protein [Gloeocapsa sp. PCC 73106]ELR97684.1 Protein of unknown function (DUF2283) [Gloeocapsa sp. PCC 73106]